MALTIRQLAEQIAQMNEDQLDSNVSVYDTDNDEYYGVNDIAFATEECQVLDVGHPILRF